MTDASSPLGLLPRPLPIQGGNPQFELGAARCHWRSSQLRKEQSRVIRDEPTFSAICMRRGWKVVGQPPLIAISSRKTDFRKFDYYANRYFRNLHVGERERTRRIRITKLRSWMRVSLQGWAKLPSPGLVNFVPAVGKHLTWKILATWKWYFRPALYGYWTMITHTK